MLLNAAWAKVKLFFHASKEICKAAKGGNDCGLKKQTLFKDLTGLWLNSASISKPRRRGRLSEHGMELCNHIGESVGIQRERKPVPSGHTAGDHRAWSRAGTLLLSLLHSITARGGAPTPTASFFSTGTTRTTHCTVPSCPQESWKPMRVQSHAVFCHHFPLPSSEPVGKAISWHLHGEERHGTKSQHH